jgi:hypothetical protein
MTEALQGSIEDLMIQLWLSATIGREKTHVERDQQINSATSKTYTAVSTAGRVHITYCFRQKYTGAMQQVFAQG